MGTEIQDFAALLRGLKDRSGLSYGALAQKLHMSTSTVHRYCNGDAVPHDYAPVERFARVCRASSDELMALHRKWILADEAKRRGARKPEAGGAAAPRPRVPGAEAAVTPSAVTPSADTPPAAPERTEAEAEPGPQTEPAPESVVEDVTPDGARSGAVPPPRRRTTRRLRVLLTAVAVVALTVPAALAVHVLGDDGPADDDGRTEAVPSHAPVVPSGRVSASASVKPSKSAGAPATTGATASASAGSSPSARPSPSSKEPVSDGGVPVHATISSYNWESPCGQYYLLDQEPDDVPPPPTPPLDTRPWARSLGAVDGGAMKLALTLQGASDEAVVLNGLHVRVLGRNAALARSAYSMGNGCGGGITPQSFDIDLDDSRPRAKPVAGEDAGVTVPAKDFPYRVSSTDVEVFHIDAHVEGHDVTWYLELEWTSGGRSGTLRIDDRGKPFRTSSLTTRPAYYYRSDTAQWVPEEY
ncbi:helix-turn-helix domain-containing protein [Streptomyces pratensis]|uniref:helix-turn-helix domain-containing protein n=1 Tax=Streptomyces pratensis TaxID=1169025 RepID=UPI0019325B83|nr:helix-turn-helix transcriptional regulator [Streptomyces pratensis]